jgi:P-type conjugative transfer protein TrbJ
MQALTAANQLAAMEQSQLLQIRALLVQEQQAMVARNAALSNSEGQQQAATLPMYETVVGPQNATGWKP